MAQILLSPSRGPCKWKIFYHLVCPRKYIYVYIKNKFSMELSFALSLELFERYPNKNWKKNTPMESPGQLPLLGCRLDVSFPHS